MGASQPVVLQSINLATPVEATASTLASVNHWLTCSGSLTDSGLIVSARSRKGRV